MAGSKCRHLNKGGLGLHTKASYQGRASPSQTCNTSEKTFTKLLTLPGKPNPGFPLFPPPLGNLANPARFPHSHSSGAARLSCGNVGISRGWRDFQGAVGRVENLSLVFHSFHGPGIS